MDPQISDFADEVLKILDRKRKYHIAIVADGKSVAMFDSLFLFRRHGAAVIAEQPGNADIDFTFEYE